MAAKSKPKEKVKAEQKITPPEIGYTPTDTEEALLAVLLDPANRLKTVTDICNLVPCSRPVYYNAFRKPEFAQLYRDESMEMVKRAVAPVLNSVVREASRGSHQHAKIILGMADMYHERKELTGKGGDPIQVDNVAAIASMSGEEIDKELRRYAAIREATKK